MILDSKLRDPTSSLVGDGIRLDTERSDAGPAYRREGALHVLGGGRERDTPDPDFQSRSDGFHSTQLDRVVRANRVVANGHEGHPGECLLE